MTDGPIGEYGGRPVYQTWDDAMQDPALDLRKGFFVADPDEPPAEPLEWPDWPEGWIDVGFIDETGRG